MTPTARSFKYEKLREWRLKLGIGQDEMARRLRYERSSISAIETGKRKPSPRFLELLQRVFNVNPETFYALALLGLLALVLCCAVCGHPRLLVLGSRHVHESGVDADELPVFRESPTR